MSIKISIINAFLRKLTCLCTKEAMQLLLKGSFAQVNCHGMSHWNKFNKKCFILSLFWMIWRSRYVESYFTLLMLKFFLKTMVYVRDEFNMEVRWWSIESSCKIVRNSITTFEAKHIARSYIKKLRYHGQGWLFQGWLAEPAWLRDSLEKFLEKFLEKRLSAV